MTIHDASNRHAFAFGGVEGVHQLYTRGFIDATNAMTRIGEIIVELEQALAEPAPSDAICLRCKVPLVPVAGANLDQCPQCHRWFLVSPSVTEEVI